MLPNYKTLLTKRISDCEKKFDFFHQNANEIHCRKNFICDTNITPNACETRKLVSTNQFKQLISTNLSYWIHGDDTVKITDDNHGGIFISCPNSNKQNCISNNNTENNSDKNIPNENIHVYKMTKLTDDQNVNIDKKYVDELIINSTQNSTSTKEMTPDTKTDALIIMGGASIIKDLCVGGGIILPNENGIPTKLNYFEEGTLNILWEGIWDHEISSVFAYQRIGRWVMLMFPYISHIAKIQNIISNTKSTFLPYRLRPIYDMNITIDGYDGENMIPISVTIYGDDGKIIIKPKNYSTFTNRGYLCGFHTFSLSFMTKE